MADPIVDQVYYNNLTKITPTYEGAATNYQTGLRGLLDGEADQLAVSELRYLQNRSRHIINNNGYGTIALKNFVTNLNAVKVVWKYATGASKGKKHPIMQDYWDKFCENPWLDGYGSMATGQGLSNASIFAAGSSHIRKLILRSDNKVVPLKLQLIPARLHAIEYTNFNKPSSENTKRIIRYGIEFENTLPVNYFYKKSILETEGIDNSMNIIKVPAEEIIHTFIRSEPGQWLGIPYLASVIMTLYKLEDLITATVNKQIVAQNVVALVEQVAGALMQPFGTPTDVTTSDNKTKTIFKNNVEEGQVLYLNKGEKATMFQGTDIGANFGTLVEQELRKVATVADALYHQLTGDTAGLNFSSLVGMSIQSRTRLEYLHNFILIPLREKPIADTFKNLAILYNSKCNNAVPYFQLPRWRGIDELKDMQADLLELQNGMGITSDKLAERGLSIEDIQSDAENRKILAEMGIPLTPAQANNSMNQANNTQANSNTTAN